MAEDLVRNFCYKCKLKIADNSVHCPKCHNHDLIPTPMAHVTEIAEFKVDTKQVSSQQSNISNIPQHTTPTSKLELDQNAVDKLLNEPFGFLTGNAGTGKSTLILELNRMYPDLFEICATTGIAAVNLNAKTIHSTLKFFNYPSLEAAWREGLLHFNLRLVRARRKKLFLDEMSMMGADMFDLIMNAVDEINSDDTGKQLGVWISGDLCQLPAIKDKQFTHEKNGDYIFKSDYWDRFANNTVRLTKVWRQDNVEFMKGINLLRAGHGKAAMDIFKSCGVNFANEVDDNFPGTTLISKNVDVDSYNNKRLQQINSPLIRVCAINKGAQHKEWQRLIPFELRLKVGALVMILCNDVPAFSYVNGDLGIIEKYDPTTEAFHIKLQRTGQTAVIGRITRPNLQDNEPEYPTGNFVPYSDFKTGQWIIGTIEYFPLRLAYASTIHKSQGLSLDTVQIDSRAQFFGFPSMAYVSISRARTPQGLYLVGSPESIAAKVKVSKEVIKYV